MDKKNNKRGIFFSTDAIIALTIILMTIMVAFPLVTYSKHKTQLHSDVIETFSNLKIGELSNSYVKSLIDSGVITDKSKTVLEMIGELYVTDRALATELTKSILSEIKTNENVGIWFDDSLISSINKTPYESASNIEATTQTISGVNTSTNSSSGFSARAYLSNTYQTKYIYLGGYIGDGNITIRLDYIGNISSATMEAAINNDSTVYVNDVYATQCSKSTDEYTPNTCPIPITSFNSGNNNISLKGNNLHIAGGFIKVIYSSDVQYEQPTRYYFPGIEGLINIYDGFYIPSAPSNINIHLNIISQYEIFFKVGNITIYNGTPGNNPINIPDSTLQSLISYSTLASTTTPLRLGMQNLSYVPTNNAYIISVADLSGGVSSAKTLECSGVCAVKNANRLLVNMLLESNITQVGLVGMQGAVISSMSHSLTRNETALNNTINTWTQGSNLDMCAGIINATDTLKSTGIADDLKIIVLLGTKFPNSCNGTSQDIDTNTYNLACQAWADYGIRIDTIGIIGGSANDKKLNNLLHNISLCANGTYYNQSASDNNIVQLYNSTARDIINIVYSSQTLSSSSAANATLYSDSYIEYEYSKPSTPFGLTLSLESQFNSPTEGNFAVPNNSTLIEANAISYSGPKWTSAVKINNDSIFNLANYGADFTKLGDPFLINLPLSKINSSNTVSITTGVSAMNSSSGSSYNKIIYKITKNASSYTPILFSATGCSWKMTFEDNTNTTVNIPSDYSGTNLCYFNSSLGLSQYNQNDAIQTATFKLLEQLDLDNNNKIDVNLNSQSLQISPLQIKGIPFLWKTEIQTRTWD